MLLLDLLAVSFGVLEGLGVHAFVKFALVDYVATTKYILHFVKSHHQLHRIELQLQWVSLLDLIYQPALICKSSEFVCLVGAYSFVLTLVLILERDRTQ